MNIISTTAAANIRQNKSRNILIAIAILLTSILLTTVPIAGLGAYLPRMAAANKVLPTFHTMYRGVSQSNLDQMKKENGFSLVGSRIDLGQMICEDATIIMSAMDTNGETLNKLNVVVGTMPKDKHDIVVSKNMLRAMGIEGDIGDTIRIPYQVYEPDGLSLQKEMDFTICGLTKDVEPNQKNMYAAMLSEAFVTESIPVSEREYRAYVSIADSKKMTTSAIQTKSEQLAPTYEVQESNIVHNDEYLLANYVDPATYSIIAVIMLIIILAAIITIYSIYHVSMMNKVQEYGKLRAMGATKKQIKSIVFREGLFVACITIPVGVLLGCLLGYAITYVLITGVTSDNVILKATKEVVQNGEVQIIQPWVVITAFVISFLTVYFSLVKPMRIASKITAVEAIRCHSTQKEKKQKRKGYSEMNLLKLTISNLSRNKKRSVITILTLGIISVLFMTIATVLSCMRPEDRARHEVNGDFALSLNSEMGNKMSPEKELHMIQQNNPLNDTLKNELEELEGVTKVETKLATHALVEEFSSEEPYLSYVTGLYPESIDKIGRQLIDGSIDQKKLQDGSGVVMGDAFMTTYMDVNVGDSFTLQLRDGNSTVSHKVTVMAITDAPRSVYGEGDFIMSAQALQQLCQTDVREGFDIHVAKQQLKAVDTVLDEMVQANDLLEYASYGEALASSQEAIEMTFNMSYAFLIILGIVGILNLINTMINSVYVRKRELGILQAIGLSDKQMLRMLQMEGLFYTTGTLLLGLLLGNFLGYLCFLYAKQNHLMDIRIYHYPVLPSVALILSILAVQLLVTYAVNKTFKKESLIDRVRFSE